jgi:hypothetical protein
MVSKGVIAEHILDPLDSHLLVLGGGRELLGVFQLVGLVGLVALEDEGSSS